MKRSKEVWYGNNFKLGILGGGQLGRMIIQEAISLNVHVFCLDPDPNAPCSQISNGFTNGSNILRTWATRGQTRSHLGMLRPPYQLRCLHPYWTNWRIVTISDLFPMSVRKAQTHSWRCYLLSLMPRHLHPEAVLWG